MTPDARTSKTVETTIVAIVLGGVFVYYHFLWGSIDAFGHAVDNYTFFTDFVRHYYTMGRRILAFPYPVDGFYYSAFFALILSPIGQLTLPTAMWVWGVIQVILTAALATIPVGRWLKLSGWRLALYVLLFATSVPVLHNFKWGQVSVLVTLTVLASLQAHASRRDVAAGRWLAFGVAIKYYAAWFVIYYIIRRQWRVVAAFGVAAVGLLVVVPSIVLGPIVTYQFHREAYDNLSVAARLFVQDWNSQFFPHVLLRLLHVVDAPQAVFALSLVGWTAVVANLAVVWILRRSATVEATALSVAALFLSLPFLVSTSWAHYLVYLPFCQAVVIIGVLGLPAGPSRYALLATAAASVMLASVFAFNASLNWGAYVWPGPLFFADILLMPAVFVLAKVRITPPTSPAGA